MKTPRHGRENPPSMTNLRRLRRLLSRALHLRCLGCGQGQIFQGLFRMAAECSACGLKFEREPGYFLGAIYINYAATVGCMLAGFFALDYFVNLSLIYQIIVWSSFGVVFPMLFYRYSKSLWLGLDYLFSPVEEDRVEMRKPWINLEEISPAVEVEDLRYLYGDREALGGVSFSVARGEMFALLGPNGGGKTTLFKILSTLMLPTSGVVRLWSHDLSREPFLVRQRLGV